MATLADTQAHQQALTDLTTLALAELVAEWSPNPSDVRDLMSDLAETFGAAASSLAADFYDEQRAAAAVTAAYTATTIPADLELAQQVAGWGIAAIVDDEPDTALSRVAAGLQRTVAGADRATIAGNVENDPGRPTFARHASANACAFCALLATRGAVYGSKDYALFKGNGDRYHDHCHCVAVPVWPGQEHEPAPYVSDWLVAYRESGSTNLSDALSSMRQTLDTN